MIERLIFVARVGGCGAIGWNVFQVFCLLAAMITGEFKKRAAEMEKRMGFNPFFSILYKQILWLLASVAFTYVVMA